MDSIGKYIDHFTGHLACDKLGTVVEVVTTDIARVVQVEVITYSCVQYRGA